MKLFIYRLAFWLWFTTRGYYMWTKIWRRVLDRKYRHQTLTAYSSLEELEAALGRMKWTADPLNGLFDIASSPQKVEHILQNSPGEAPVGDCDEFATYSAISIQSMIQRNKVSLSQPYVMTVNWFDKDGKFHGHNICVFEVQVSQTWGHVGNWHDGKAQLGFASLQDVAETFAGGGTLIAWACSSPEMNRLELLSVW